MEALAQLGGIMMMDAEKAAENPEFFFAGIESCKWRRPVVPGDTLVNTKPLLHSLCIWKNTQQY